MAPSSTSPSANVTSDANFWPEPFTVHQPHQHSRVFIGPFPHTSAKPAHGHERYLSNEVEEGDDYHVKGRKRDVVRRQKRKVLQRRRRGSSAGAWGDDDGGAESSSSGSSFSEGGSHADDPDGRTSRRRLRRPRRKGQTTTDGGTGTDTDVDGTDGRPPRRLKRWVQDARGSRSERSSVGGAAASTGDGLPSSGLHNKQASGSTVAGITLPTAEEEELVNTIMAPVRDEDVSAPPADRGWWKVRWEGDRRRMSVSSSINGFTMPPPPPPPAPTLASVTGAQKRRHSIASPTLAGFGSALGFNHLRNGLNASSSTGSTTLASESRLPAIKTASETATSPVAGSGSRPRPYLLDPRNQLPPPPSPASHMSAPKRPSRQGSRSSERSAETFYSARTNVGPLPTPGSTRTTFLSNGLVDSPPPSDDEADDRLPTSSGLSSQCFPSSTTSVDAPAAPSLPPLPRIVHTEASPNASASSSFIAHPTPLPTAPAAPPPLRSAMRRPTQPILKGPSASTPPNLLQTVHFPPATTPSPSIGKRLVSDLKARGAGAGGAGLRPMVAIEDRAEVIGSSGGEQSATFGAVSGDDEPAPPEEVLNREGGTGVEGDGGPMTAIPFEPDDDFKVGDVIMRDRMLVKKQWCRSSGLPPGYNEQTQRKIPVDRSEAWEERLVVLKRGRVEIYDDWGLPFRERFVGVKKLVHVIYLQKETSLSLYSNTDLTFCLLTPPTSLKDARSTRSSSGIKSRMPRITRNGTSIFIFKIKSRTRAIDWMWELYIQLRGPQALPRYLDVHVPAFNNARVRLRVPVVGEDPGFDSLESVLRRLTRKQVIKHCARILSDVEGFRSLLVECGALSASDLEHGGVVRGDDVDKHLALAWRHGDRLDWIWADDDVLQQSRDWNVLAGAGPLQSLTQPAKLELRLARHTASILHLNSGTRVTEPPAVEGYLHRIRPKTGVKTFTYLTVHDGCIFICSPVKAHPPAPPAGLEVDDAGGKGRTEHDRPTTEAGFKRGERIRAIQQILGSNGFLDFRDIESVARATTEHVRRPRPTSRTSSSSPRQRISADDDGDEAGSDDDGWESLSDDERDLGGDEGLKAVEDHKTLQERRQIVVRLTNGDSFVFEAHSALVAREWIDRLNSLRIYWTEKHLEEAQQEMEVSRSTRIRLPAGLMGTRQRQWDSDDELEDPDDPPAYIEDFWNWCVLDACRPIVKAGRLFSKRRHWQFRAKYNILVHGHLVQFSLDLDRPIHTRSHRFFLIDAYVYTGYLAQEGLPPSSNEAAYLGKGEPRRYADGFQTDDGSEDTVLVIWYRPHFVTADKNKYIARAQQDAQYVPPALGNSGHQKLVLRARSKLERDAWASALNLEIERLARRRKDREDRIRGTGNVL